MLNKIISFSIGNKLIIGIFTLALIVFGIYEVGKLPIDAVPDITDNQVQVITVAPSFGATDIERLVTFPIEQANSNIAGIKEIRSFSRFGLSLVTIVFNDGIDVYWARQQVTERLQQISSQIPQGIGIPELGPISTGLGEIYQYVVRPKEGYENKISLTELRTTQDWIIRRQLLGVKGVAEVSSFGGKLKQYEIEIDPNKLSALGVTIHDVFTAVEKGNQNTGGSYIEKGPTVLSIRTEGLVEKIEDLEMTYIKSTDSGSPLLLRDVAEIKEGYATRYGALGYNDKGEVAGAVVMMLKGANSSEVIQNIRDRIEDIQKTLPEGIVIEPFLDRTKMVDNSIRTVETNLLEGALIVVFILVLFLGNFRAGLLVASVIPLAMLFAIIMMNLFGVSGNLMSLGALDFGLIVDGAVIIVEATMHQLSISKLNGNKLKLTQNEMDGEVKKSASKMMNSAVFGQIIILIVYLPIFSLQGIEGKMFKPMAQTVAFALIGAFILSLTYIPMMSAWILSKKTTHKQNVSDRLMSKLEAGFSKLFEVVIQKTKIVYSSVIVLFILAMVTLSQLGGEFIPVLEEGDFAVETRVLAGSNLNTSLENTQKAAKILLDRFPEVIKVVTKIGSGEVPTDPMPMEAADLMIILKDKKEWKSAKTFNELAEKMGEELKDIPGVTFGFQYPVQMRFNELMTGARQDVVCKIFGENLDTLALYAAKLGKLANAVDGSENLFVEPITGMPQILVKYDRNALVQYHLTVEDVNKVVNSAFAGQVAGLIFEDEKRFNLVVRLKKEQRSSLEDVQNLLIPSPKGTQIPLNQLATVAIEDGPNQIQREDAKRRIVVGFNARNRDIQSLVSELQNKVQKELNLPPGYFVTYGGAFENLQEANKRLAVAVPIALLLIFILLYFAFGSIRHGLIIYTAIPLSAMGGIFFLALRGLPFSISAGVGFIALFGVAVLNGIVLLAEFNRLKKSGMKDLKEIVKVGTKSRLRPVLMTAFVASLGFLPMAISNGAGAEVQRPLATVVIGGLMLATFLTLFVLPLLYIFVESRNDKRTVINTKAVGFFVVLFVTSGLFAQKTIDLPSAINLALKNNLSLNSERLLTQMNENNKRGSVQLSPTALGFDYGQMNSVYNDNAFSIGQGFHFPTVYKNDKNRLLEQWNFSLFNVNLKEKEITQMVEQVYYTLLVLREKERLLVKVDSLFDSFQQKSKLQLATGEKNGIEFANTTIQRAGIQQQLTNLKKYKQELISQFQILLHAEEIIQPIQTDIKANLSLKIDSTLVLDHPLLAMAEKQIEIEELKMNIQKSYFIPDFNLRYNNMSMRGSGADDIFYSGSKRFQSLSLGVGIPVFNRNIRTNLKSLDIQKKIAENNFETQKESLLEEYKKALYSYKENLRIVEYYEVNVLPSAQSIYQKANLQLLEGEISFIEWGFLVNQAIDAENNYIDGVKMLNESIIRIHFLTRK